MRIVVVGPIFPDSFARNITFTLSAMGHELVVMPGTRAYHHQSRLPSLFWRYAPQAFPIIERRMWSDLISRAKAFAPQLVLVSMGNLSPQTVDELKAACDAKVVCWYTDAIANLYRHYLVAAPYDAVFLKDPWAVRSLQAKLDIPFYYLPEACNPSWHRTVESTEQEQQKYRCDVAGIGSLHYFRAKMLEQFVGYDLKIWGANNPGWIETSVKPKYQNRSVAELEKAKALRSAKVVVNPTNFLEVEGVNCSLFEIAGCGAFQITESKPSLPQLFDEGTEIVTYRTRRELKEKVDYYLAHEQERQEIADRAQRRAHREHTYELRLKKMLETLGFLTPKDSAESTRSC